MAKVKRTFVRVPADSPAPAGRRPHGSCPPGGPEGARSRQAARRATAEGGPLACPALAWLLLSGQWGGCRAGRTGWRLAQRRACMVIAAELLPDHQRRPGADRTRQHTDDAPADTGPGRPQDLLGRGARWQVGQGLPDPAGRPDLSGQGAAWWVNGCPHTRTDSPRYFLSKIPHFLTFFGPLLTSFCIDYNLKPPSFLSCGTPHC